VAAIKVFKGTDLLQFIPRWWFMVLSDENVFSMFIACVFLVTLIA